MCSQAGEVIPPLSLVLGSSRPLLVHHVAQRLRISRRMVRHLAETGKLRGFKPGRKIWYFSALDVDHLRARREARYD